jgi:cell division septum initiation protein DivIVA
MPRKKSANPGSTNLNVGNLSKISGNVNIAGGDIRTQQTIQSGLSTAEIQQLFDSLYAAVESRAETTAADKEDLRAEIEEIQAKVTEAAQNDEKVEEGFLSRRFRNIARMAPDVLDVIAATLGNPLAGLGVAVKKIAEKAKEEAS